jgi:8-oxo-dGTP pyrophosphatase MutT (NUDIX family)
MASQPGLLRQAAVVPLNKSGQICLVSSRSGKRWVVPKGNMEPGKSAGEIGLQEAWEEAGLVGLLQGEPIGSYVYEKDGFVCHVIVFVMDVTEQVDFYPEVAFRRRQWVSPEQAIDRLEEAGLREMVRTLTLAEVS